MTAHAAGVERLAHWWAHPVDFVRDNFQVEPDAWQADALQAFSTHAHLLWRLFTSDIKCILMEADPGQALQQDCRFPNTRIAAEQNYRTFYQAPAEYPVEFIDLT